MAYLYFFEIENMVKKRNHSKIHDGYIRIFNEMKAEYQQINQPIRVKAVENKNIFSIGKHIILSGHKPMKEGSLIQVKFDLKNRFNNKSEDVDNDTPYKRCIGIGQVLRILERKNETNRMLIRILDLFAT